MSIVVVVVKMRVGRFDFRTYLMHGRRRWVTAVGRATRADELRRLQKQLVRLSCHFAWQLHRHAHTTMISPSFKNHENKTTNFVFEMHLSTSQEKNKHGDTTHRRALPQIPAQETRAMRLPTGGWVLCSVEKKSRKKTNQTNNNKNQK